MPIFVDGKPAAKTQDVVSSKTQDAARPKTLAETERESYATYVRAKKEMLQYGESIPEKYWSEEVRSLTPVRMYADGLDMAIVLREKDGIEEGKYVVSPASEFSHGERDGFIVFQLNQTLGAGVYDYQRPMQTAAQDAKATTNSLIQAMQKTCEAYRRDTKAPLELGQVIPEKYWTEEIRQLKPVRMYADGLDLAVVLRESNGIEEGKYLTSVLSSQAHGEREGFIMLQPDKSQASSSKHALVGLYDFERVSPQASQSANVSTKRQARPSYVPETSVITADGRIEDKTDLPFVNDPDVLGVWKTVDFLNKPGEFHPDQKQLRGEPLFKELIFYPDGKTSQAWRTWTKGVVLHQNDKTASRYEIIEIKGTTYLLLEWKSGDYTKEHRQPCYYVLKKEMLLSYIKPGCNVPQGEDIPKKFWADSLLPLNPIRVYRHRNNVVVVQREADGVEEGIYIYVSISSYVPWKQDDGFTFVKAGGDFCTYKRGKK